MTRTPPSSPTSTSPRMRAPCSSPPCARSETSSSAPRSTTRASAPRSTRDPHGSPTPTPVAMGETVLATSTKAASGSQRHLVLVHYNADTGAVHLNDGPNLADETGRRLLCDAALLGIAQNGTDVLNIGRSSPRPLPTTGSTACASHRRRT